MVFDHRGHIAASQVTFRQVLRQGGRISPLSGATDNGSMKTVKTVDTRFPIAYHPAKAGC